MHDLAAIILAAGQSSRFGAANKLLAPLNGRPLLAHSLDTVCKLGLGQIIVVSGHDHEAIAQIAQPYAVRVQHNPAYKTGMGSSIACGATALNPEVAGVFLCLGDMPYLTDTVFQAVVDQFTAHGNHGRKGSRAPGSIVRPVFEGRPGHPVLFPADVFPALAGLTGELGARDIIAAEQSRLLTINWPDHTVLADIDRPEDLPG
ncbi:nucleotidyltransferase family protein [Parvularcula sp. IMCC14364]|uniref:nucleotidyltransferase family protein n=1 Tax=Parvularcula sp. IMCC14364 TaxID=3067902 RepID=UPI002740688A|nr:nucleotidyltransferase family protein [Parvularcula sp. IMCC14364]